MHAHTDQTKAPEGAHRHEGGCCGGHTTKTAGGGGCHGSTSDRDEWKRPWRMVGYLALLTVLALSALSFLGLIPESQGATQDPVGVEEVAPERAWEAVTAGEEAVLIDVRTRAEYLLQGHPTPAMSLPWKYWEDVSGSMVPNPDFVAQVSRTYEKDRPIYLLCRSGHRSGQAAAALIEAGFTRVWSVEGGMQGRGEAPGWAASDLPVTADRHPGRWLDSGPAGE